jgi:S-adenosylmethionine uptake transporter
MIEIGSASRPLRGIGLTALGYGLFSVQDATVKWLVVHYAVPQILFTRSLVIIAIACLIGGRRNMPLLVQSRNKMALVMRAALILFAWLSYYTAARSLGLAELTTLYYAAPIIVVVLSVLILKENVSITRWLVVLVGFGGVVLAADPAGSVNIVPASMAVFAACCWGLSVILVRLISKSETTANQMIVSNALFAAVCALMLAWCWKTPDPFSLLLMLGLGLAGGLGQFFLYEGFRFAPASVVAPIEYTGLVWAFLYGYVIWADIPKIEVFAGAALIVISSLALIWFERRRALRLAASV